MPCEKMSKKEQKVTKLWPLQNSSPIILVQTIVIVRLSSKEFQKRKGKKHVIRAIYSAFLYRYLHTLA